MGKSRIFTLVLLAVSTGAWAQEGAPTPAPAAPAAKGEKKKDVPLMDFEADVIEGKRKAPDLFLLTENQKLSPDAILFLRKDFNEFHEKDSKQRPMIAP